MVIEMERVALGEKVVLGEEVPTLPPSRDGVGVPEMHMVVVPEGHRVGEVLNRGEAVLVGEGEEGEDAADAAVMAPGRRRRASV